MKDALTMSYINMYGVLRNLEELVKRDEQAKALISGQSLTIAFIVAKGPRGWLKIKDDDCTFSTVPMKSQVTLYFSSPEHFNKMVDGQSKPIPLKGFKYLKFLTKEFEELTNLLAHYLRPTKDYLKDSHYFTLNTYLSAYTAFYALAQIGNYDPIGVLSAKRIPEGKILVYVDQGPSLYLECNKGHLTVHKGMPESYRASMGFMSLQVANAMLNGEKDAYSCIASGELEMKGFIPMLDHMNKLLGQVKEYVK